MTFPSDKLFKSFASNSPLKRLSNTSKLLPYLKILIRLWWKRATWIEQKMTKKWQDRLQVLTRQDPEHIYPVPEEWRWHSVVIRNSIINQNLIMIMKFLFLSEVSRVLGVSRRCQERTWRHQRREWGKISFIRATRKSQSWRPCQERT